MFLVVSILGSYVNNGWTHSQYNLGEMYHCLPHAGQSTHTECTGCDKGCLAGECGPGATVMENLGYGGRGGRRGGVSIFQLCLADIYMRVINMSWRDKHGKQDSN